MDWTNAGICACLEMTVVIFQVFGVMSLCLYRLLPETPWAGRGKLGYIAAMLGLGAAGALCGRHDSEFALFAGATMTLLLIGMIAGNNSVASSPAVFPTSSPGPYPAA